MKKSIPKKNFQPFEEIDDKINGFFILVDISKQCQCNLSGGLCEDNIVVRGFDNVNKRNYW